MTDALDPNDCLGCSHPDTHLALNGCLHHEDLPNGARRYCPCSTYIRRGP